MSIDSNDKLDLLWKHFKGVSPTSETKAAHNESVRSADPTFQQNFWTDSDRIPTPAPTTITPAGNELWYDVITPRKATFAIQMVADPSTDNTAFHAMTDTLTGISEEKRIRNWVPASFHPSYTITVWAGKPGDLINLPQRLSAVAEGYEWTFDYNTGVLFFPNGIPALAKQNGIWIEGWVYIGEIGRASSGGGNANTSKIRTFTFTTAVLAVGGFADFTFETGGKVVLVEAKVTSAATLECHAMSARTDTNPYRFKAVNTHLVDDGSYTVAGTRFYGERFVQLINMEDTTSSNTYWRVYNDDTSPRIITVIVSVA
ncbi:hypothetical protein D3C72_255000 [compost metagenome]